MDFDFTGYFWSVCKATRSIFVRNTPTKFFVSLHKLAHGILEANMGEMWHKNLNNRLGISKLDDCVYPVPEVCYPSHHARLVPFGTPYAP